MLYNRDQFGRDESGSRPFRAESQGGEVASGVDDLQDHDAAGLRTIKDKIASGGKRPDAWGQVVTRVAKKWLRSQ
jgi:hypothetical protein